MVQAVSCCDFIRTKIEKKEDETSDPAPAKRGYSGGKENAARTTVFTTLPVTQVRASENNSKAIFANAAGEDVLKAAESGLGVPCVRGGTTTSGWACSGYVTWAGRKPGADMGRITNDMAGDCADSIVTSGSSDTEFNNDFRTGKIKPADIVVFSITLATRFMLRLPAGIRVSVMHGTRVPELSIIVLALYGVSTAVMGKSVQAIGFIGV